ncbi:MAG: shikimate dehydrogenase [Anaerolineales bacterium]
MQKLVLLGSPVAHSISPAIQNAAFASAGLDWSFEAMEVAPEKLAATITRMRADDWLGANITIPFKETVVQLLDMTDPTATKTSAVNTIVNRSGRLVGHNTDLPGFIRDLRAHWRIPSTARSLILGAGGAARAAAFGLAQEGIELSFIARTVERAERLASDIRQAYAVEVAIHPWASESFLNAASQCTLIVNATPVGLVPDTKISPWPDDVSLPPSAFVYDMVYSPKETKLIRQAQREGLKAVSGTGMLLEQAALSYELWTGLRAPRSNMRATLEDALERIPPRGSTEIQAEVLDA